MQKDFYIAEAVAKVFGDCDVRIEHVRKYIHRSGVFVEANTDKRITVIYVDLQNWVSPRIRTSGIRIMRYEHPIMVGTRMVNTMCRLEGNTSEPWVQQHWRHDDFMASTTHGLGLELHKWKAELEAY